MGSFSTLMVAPTRAAGIWLLELWVTGRVGRKLHKPVPPLRFFWRTDLR